MLAKFFLKSIVFLFLYNKNCNNIINCDVFKSFLITKYIIIDENIFREEKIINAFLIIVVFRHKI